MQSSARRERTLTPRVHTRPGAEDTQGGIVEGATRRDFLRLTLLGTLGAMLLGGAGAFVAFFYPKRTSAFGSNITAPVTVSDIKAAPTEIIRVREGKFYLSPVQTADGKLGLMALYWKCKHLGCTVPWKPDDPTMDEIAGKGRFNCPCHGSLYDRYGNIISGPAPRPMFQFPLTIRDGKVYVTTNPTQAESKTRSRDTQEIKSDVTPA